MIAVIHIPNISHQSLVHTAMEGIVELYLKEVLVTSLKNIVNVVSVLPKTFKRFFFCPVPEKIVT